jgi:kumamolisin
LITVTIRLRRKTEEGLPTVDEFIRGVRAKNVTRADLLERYAASPEGAAAVEEWVTQQGLKIAEVDLPGRRIRVTGSIAQVERAFGLKLSVYRHSKTGAAFRCPENDPSIPTALTPYVAWVNGLNTMPAVVRHLVRVGRKAAQSDPKDLWSGSFYPNEVAKLYNFPPTTGAGQSIAILEFGGGIDRSVLEDYFKQAIGLAQSPTINTISILNTPIQVDDEVTGEVYLDIEVVGAMAPGATMDVYFAPWTGDGYLTAIEAAIRKTDYSAISISYGIDEDLVGDAQQPAWPALHEQVDEAFREAAAIGVPLFVSSGDQGSSSLRGQVGQQEVTVYGKIAAAAYPASSIFAKAVGGTMLYAEGGAISKEIVWIELGPLQNNSYYLGGATGGGVSDKYPAPSYQSDAGIAIKSVNRSGAAGRVVPDVAGNRLEHRIPGEPDTKFQNRPYRAGWRDERRGTDVGCSYGLRRRGARDCTGEPDLPVLLQRLRLRMWEDGRVSGYRGRSAI